MATWFMCREARPIFNLTRAGEEPILFDRAVTDQAVLMFGAVLTHSNVISGKSITDLITMKPLMGDCPPLFFFTDPEYVEKYRYVTEQYVTRDYTRNEMVRMANVIADHDVRVIERIGNLCKNLDHFTIPYLAGALDQQGSQVIESLRREDRLDQAVMQSPRIELPPLRPTEMRERMQELFDDRKFDDALREKKRRN